MKEQEIAFIIFESWHKGEGGQGYETFKKYLKKDAFQIFSHPLIGNFNGEKGFEKLINLIDERELNPNQLSFSNVVKYQENNAFCFQFNSSGKVANGFDYEGYNIIQIEVADGFLIVFREYFSFINPAWFQNK